MTICCHKLLFEMKCCLFNHLRSYICLIDIGICILNHSVICFVSAKFLKLEQLDQDPGFPADTAGVSLDGTGQVGTYFYTAPEIEQGWPKIDEKVNV